MLLILTLSGILDATLAAISGGAVVVVPVNVVVTNGIPKCGSAEGHMLSWGALRGSVSAPSPVGICDVKEFCQGGKEKRKMCGNFVVESR